MEKQGLMFEDVMEHVRKFNEKFNIPIGNGDGLVCNKDSQILMYDLLIEEVVEFKDACEECDQVEIADALGDILFVVLSAAIAHGMHKNNKLLNVIHEICRSNLTKDAAKRYKEGEKRTKGDKYEPPRIKEIITGKLELI
jgi:NTP pyrophosphatase (non-canonical NTP hydrolase)